MDTVSEALPAVGIVTVRVPVVTPKSPDCATLAVTSNGLVGAGDADTVNTASPPSEMSVPGVMLTAGSDWRGKPPTVNTKLSFTSARYVVASIV